MRVLTIDTEMASENNSTGSIKISEDQSVRMFSRRFARVLTDEELNEVTGGYGDSSGNRGGNDMM